MHTRWSRPLCNLLAKVSALKFQTSLCPCPVVVGGQRGARARPGPNDYSERTSSGPNTQHLLSAVGHKYLHMYICVYTSSVSIAPRAQSAATKFIRSGQPTKRKHTRMHAITQRMYTRHISPPYTICEHQRTNPARVIIKICLNMQPNTHGLSVQSTHTTHSDELLT